MHNGICPKCSSEQVYNAPAESTTTGMGTSEGLLYLQILNANWLSTVTQVRLSSYVCQSCGYIEMYVDDAEALSKLEASANWRKVDRQS